MNVFSAWGYLLFTFWGMVMALTLQGWRLAVFAGMEFLFGLAWSRKGLSILRRFRFWAFIGLAVALGPWLIRRNGATESGSALWRAGLVMGLEMAGRALGLVLAFGLGLSSLSLSDLMAVFEGVHLRGLGFALGVAMNMLDMLERMGRVTFETIKLRGGLRRPLLSLRLFMVTLVSNTLRYGDGAVNAATVRAFDPSQDRGSRLVLRRSDLLLLSALVVVSFLCWVL